MKMTVEEVRVKLGLRPFDEFALERYRWLCSEERVKELGVTAAVDALYDRRCTGKTTEIGCMAIAAASEGREVRFTMNQVAFDNVCAMAADAGVDPTLFVRVGDPDGLFETISVDGKLPE